MRISTYLAHDKKIFSDYLISTVNQFYNVVSTDWLTSAIINAVNDTIELDFGYRELVDDNDNLSTLETRVNKRSTNIIIRNYMKYDRLFKVFNMEYNPLWNVDGVETTTRVTESENSTNGESMTETTYDTETEDNFTDELTLDTSENYDNTTTHSGTDETTVDYDKTETSGINETSTESRTTFDSSNFNDTDKNVKIGTDTVTGSGSDVTSVSHGEIITDDSTTTRGGTETTTKRGTQTHTGKDKTEGTTSGTDTGTVNESIELERHGNIGVTSSQKLFTEETQVAELNKIIDIIALDVARAISLGV